MSAKKGNQLNQLSAELRSLKQAVASSASLIQAKKSKPGKQGVSRKPSKRSEMISAPAAQGVKRGGTFNPSISASSRSGRVSVVIRSPPGGEFVADQLAVTGGAFTVVTNQPVNPGNQTLFPWLSSIASKFEGYRFRRLVFRSETEAATSKDGAALLAFDPNVLDSAPTTKQELLDLAVHVRSPDWANISLNVPLRELDLMAVTRYVRAGNVPTGADAKTYDVGNFYFAYSSTNSATNLCELYVDYDIELIGMQQNYLGLLSASTFRSSPQTGISRTAPFGATQNLYGTAPITITNTTTLTFNQPGQYMFGFDLVGTVITNTLPTIGGTATDYTGSAGYTTNIIYVPTAATSGWFPMVVSVTAAGQTITLDFTPSCTTLTNCDIYASKFLTSAYLGN